MADRTLYQSNNGKLAGVVIVSCIVILIASIMFSIIAIKRGDKVDVLPAKECGFGTSALVFKSDGVDGMGHSIAYGRPTRLGPFKISEFSPFGSSVMGTYAGK